MDERRREEDGGEGETRNEKERRGRMRGGRREKGRKRMIEEGSLSTDSAGFECYKDNPHRVSIHSP